MRYSSGDSRAAAVARSSGEWSDDLSTEVTVSCQHACRENRPGEVNAREDRVMPRIEAPTVAEHHAMRRAAIVSAARELLADGGPAAVTPAAVAGRAGLARTSVYQYFPSTDALVAAAVEETFARANAGLADAAAAADDAVGRLHAYVRHALVLAANDHAPMRGWGPAELPPACVARMRELHEAMVAPLRSAL